MSKSNFSAVRQRGVVLVVVLILLLVMALVGIAMLRGTLMEEGMSGAMMDRSLSFQAAEAALREGEALAANTKPVGTVDACVSGVCGIQNPENTPVWEVQANWAAAPETTVDLGGLTAKSRYLVELMADNVPRLGSCTTGEDVSPEAACVGTESRYRITARSEAAGRSEVMLQTVFAVP